MYDLKRPHMVLRSPTQDLIVQDGFVYERGSKKSLGSVEKHRVIFTGGNPEIKFCKFCGGTFHTLEGFQEHVVKMHRDLLVSRASKRAPKDLGGTWTPSEEMVRDEADKLLAETVEADKPEPEKDPEEDPEKDGRRGKRKNWREPVG